MKLDAKLKGGLAWAGLVVILAVPSADILFGKSDGAAKTTANTATVAELSTDKATPAARLDPIETASIDAKDPVEVYVNKGKKLPSYISDGNAASAEKPAALKPAAPVEKPAEVASIAPATEMPPIPLPRSARPKWTNTATAPAEEVPLIIDESEVASVNPAKPVAPFPLSDDGTDNGTAPEVTSDQLEEWDSGSLADYLAKKGLLSDNSRQPAEQQTNEYDPDGFFLDEGPNAKRRLRQDDSLFLF